MSARSNKLRPASLRTLLRVATGCLIVVAVTLAGAALAALKPILTPLLIAVFVFYMLKPAVDQVARWRLPRWLAYPLLMALVALGSLAVAQVFYQNVDALRDKLPSYEQQLSRAVEQLEASLLFGAEEPAPEASLAAALRFSPRQIVEYTFGTVLHFVEVLVLVLFYLLYLFIEAGRFPGRVRAAFRPETAEKYLHIGQNIDLRLKRFLLCKTLVNAGLAATTGLLGYAFGLDFWPVWAVMMFLANYVTYIGSVVALVPMIALALVQFESLTAALALGGLLVLNRVAWIDYIEIRLLGQHLNLSPLLLLLAIAFFGLIWGTVGMLLAVPLVTSLKIVLENFESSRPLAVLVSEE